MYFGGTLSRFEGRPAARLVIGAAHGTLGLRGRQQTLPPTSRSTLGGGWRIGSAVGARLAIRARRLRLARCLVDRVGTSVGGCFGLLSDRLRARRSSITTVLFLEGDLLFAQPRQALAALPLGIVDTRGCDEARQAFPLTLLEACFRRRSLVRNPFTSVAQTRCRRHLRHRLTGTGDQQQHGGNERSGRHVSEVSTSRFAKARNSGDAISCKRDTVRGNSWASGPSVYNASAGTAADRINLTRRS